LSLKDESLRKLIGISELRRLYIAQGLDIDKNMVLDFGTYSIASKDNIYVLIDNDRVIYVFKPIYKRPHKPKLLERLRSTFKLPISKLKPPIPMSGGVIIPALVGGEEVKDFEVRGWRLRRFKGSFIIRDIDKSWVEGYCLGLAATPSSWDAEEIPLLIKKLVSFVERL